MNEDALSHATRALRARYDGARDGASNVERRIVARVRQNVARRRARLRWLLPIAAVLAASSAWAGAGRVLPALSRVAESLFQSAPAAVPRQPESTALHRRSRADQPETKQTPSPSLPTRGSASVAPPASALEALPSASVEARAAVITPRPSTARAPASANVASSRAVPEAPAVDVDALYREAHRLHFVDKNPAAALSAWNRYIEAGPRGALVLEARYNRAVTLVRLGRDAEAVEALRPFARGEYGPYRRAEAEALIQKLSP